MINTNNRFFWLASYPKSGNTWMRVFLSNYFSNTKKPIDINQLNYGWDILSYENIERQLALGASNLYWEEILDYLPRVFEVTAQQEPYPHFVKIHSAYIHTRTGEAVFAPHTPCAAVYMIRNPLDIAVSFSFHDGSSLEKVISEMNNPNTFLDYQADKIFRKFPEKLLSWSQHVISWVDQKDIPICVVRYEDLLKDPFTQFKRVLAFLDESQQLDEAHLQQSIVYSQFDQLQSQEIRYGFREKLTKSKRFFRKGQVNSWQDYQSSLLPNEIISYHQKIMIRFGYLNQNGELI